jgi:uncharacterized membrane protein
MQKILKIYFLFILILLIIDSIYLFGLKNIHNKQIKDIQKEDLQVRYYPAVLFYLIAGLAFVYYIYPLGKKNETDIIKYGALMGLLMYGTFDFTNLALFKNYTLKYAIMDTVWGMTVMAISSYLVFKIIH